MQENFLSETVIVGFLGFEVSILVAYLVITSIYQVLIHALYNRPDLKHQVYLSAVRTKLLQLLFISIMTVVIILISTSALIFKCLWLHYLSLFGFIVVIMSFLFTIVTTISGFRKNPMED